jgi:hypothetical protein
MPAHAATVRATVARPPRARGATTPTSPPTANSQARVGVAKNAIAGLAAVQTTDVTNEATAVQARTATSQVRSLTRRLPRAAASGSSRSSGQSR